MRVAIYNQMFGLEGKSFWKNLLGHWAVHYQSNEKEIWKRTDLDRTIKIIQKVNPDIIGICEILCSQQKELKFKLKKIGYNYFSFSYGHKLKHYNIYVTELIISKFPFKRLHLAKWPVEDKLGGGGDLEEFIFLN
jgi:hypothetical protein